MAATEKPSNLIILNDSAYYTDNQMIASNVKYKDTLNNDNIEFVRVERQPEIIKIVNPKYPNNLQSYSKEEICWVKIWVDQLGVPKLAIITRSPNKIYNEPTLVAAMQWKFKPAIMKSKPVSVWISIPFKIKNQ